MRAQGYTATEYADAFLFGEENQSASDSSSPPSILDGERR